jgi:hypothetical protein
MATFIYRCLNIDKNVQGWTAEECEHEDTYVPVQCHACRQFHHVNPLTGKVLGGDNDDDE